MVFTDLCRCCGSSLIHVFLFFILMGPDASTAQHQADSSRSSFDRFYEWCDQQYGKDDILVSGKIYIPPNPLIDRQPYFESDEWITGTLFIEGRKYDQQELKFNLATRQLILNATFRQGASARIILSSAKIDSLYLADHLFINGLHLFPDTQDTSFYEIIYRDQFLFISRYHKEYIRKYSSSTPYGLWSHQVSYHSVFTGTWSAVPSKRAFLFLFPEGQEEIKQFMRKRKIKFKKATIDEMKQLVAFSSTYYHP